MPQVSVTVAGRAYRMACAEGEEKHLAALAERLDQRIGTLRREFGEIGDGRITVMAAITVLDDLAEAEMRLAVLKNEIAALKEDRAAGDRRIDVVTGATVRALDGVTAEIDAMARLLAGAEEEPA